MDRTRGKNTRDKLVHVQPIKHDRLEQFPPSLTSLLPGLPNHIIEKTKPDNTSRLADLYPRWP